ncbi:MAG: DeoR/GlpR family DNA-binding transcription regulator [Pseudomonadota bacterium]
MKIEERQKNILDLLRVQGAVEVEDLAERFSLTTQTIRQDLRELDERGLVKRTHGGARRVASVSNRDYSERRAIQGPAKRAIGEVAASLIPNNCSLTLNIGTTTEQVARALSDHQDLMIISNNINIITQLLGSKSKDLILMGGRVRQSDGAVVGEDAVEFISRYKVDYAVIGASALDNDGAILDFDAREVSVARAILKNARTRILVADTTKFEVNAPVRICNVSDVDYFITDVRPPPSFVGAADRGETKIIVAKPGGLNVVRSA